MTEIRIITPQSESWGDFQCGDPRIDRKLLAEVEQAKKNLVRLHGLYEGDRLQAVISLEASVLQAPTEVIAKLGGRERVSTLHIEVLSVRKSAQGRGYGRTLLRHALRQAEAVVVRKILQATFEDSVAASSLTQG
ncbi:GNAT family N-acetyltransferase [Deinococcus radiophilus]|uniref:GNAT family N-acetyltransferase n=1 Tax=Deinococcus radiophilus TaxID=32062 RepID=UPI001E3B5E1B|nr:GNAT family N-acetyltransferase [Deinococcus radiophilus]UFA51956.1 GNAT family N-acetyltransferase [Deinococcus radiophilus]